MNSDNPMDDKAKESEPPQESIMLPQQGKIIWEKNQRKKSGSDKNIILKFNRVKKKRGGERKGGGGGKKGERKGERDGVGKKQSWEEEGGRDTQLREASVKLQE